MIQAIKAGTVAAVLLFGAMAMPAVADSGRNFTVYNGNSDVSVQRVWTARAGESKDPWHEVDMKYAIKPKTSSNFTMGTGNVCLYDIKIQFSDEVVQQFDNVNVCKGQTVNAT
jgi:hypothetical protein